MFTEHSCKLLSQGYMFYNIFYKVSFVFNFDLRFSIKTKNIFTKNHRIYMKSFIKSKLLFIYFSFILCNLQVLGTNNLVVTYTNNESLNYLTKNIKSIRFDSKNMVFHSKGVPFENMQQTMSTPLNEVRKISFKKNELPVNTEQTEILNTYPYPTDGWLHISNTHENQQIYLYNITGTCVLEFQTNSICTSIDLSELEKGIYILRINSQTEKIIKR